MAANELLGHPTHDSERKTTMDPSVGLPLSNAGMGAVPAADAVKKLLSCRAKRAENRETERHKIEAVTSTRVRVLVPLRLLNNRQDRDSVPPTPSSRADADQVNTTVAIISLVTFIKIKISSRNNMHHSKRQFLILDMETESSLRNSTQSHESNKCTHWYSTL